MQAEMLFSDFDIYRTQAPLAFDLFKIKGKF